MFYTIQKKERWQRSIAYIPISSVKHRAMSETSACDRSALLEDNNSDKSSQNKSNVLLFSSARPYDSSAKPEKQILEMTMMMPRIKETKCVKLDKRWANTICLYIEAHDKDDHHLCHLCDQEIKEEYRRENDLTQVTKQAHLHLVCKMSGTLEREKKKKHGCHNISI